MPQWELNYFTIFLAAIVEYVLGAFWYSPLLFGKMWMKEMNITKESIEKMKDKMWKSYLMTFVGALIMAVALNYFIDALQVTLFVSGALIGVIVWFGFIIPKSMSGVLWCGQSMKLFLIDSAYYLVSFVLMGGILAVM